MCQKSLKYEENYKYYNVCPFERLNTLHIYGQENGTGALNAQGGTGSAGIGGKDGGNSGNIIINGGNITAVGGSNNMTGSNGGAGIGAGAGSTAKTVTSGSITINGGTVNATGGTVLTVSGGAGIGGSGKNSTINGSITINGGVVNAQGGYSSAGIGGGYGHDGFDVIITGGVVNAAGAEYAAGIGGGSNGKGGTTTISGGIITAAGNTCGAGIGGGNNGSGGNINISGGIVTANGGISNGSIGGAGIGGGNSGAGGSVNISGGTISAIGGTQSAGIGGGVNGSGGTVKITGGSVNAKKEYEQADNIGKGRNGSDSGTLKNNSVDVFLVTIYGLPINKSVDIMTSPTDYGLKDVKTDNNGNLYLYLPTGTTDIIFDIDNTNQNHENYEISANHKNTISILGIELVDYVDEHGYSNRVSCEVLTGGNTTLSSGWYVVKGDVTTSDLLVNDGESVNLIISDGAKLTANGTSDHAGIGVKEGTSLTIYGQSAGTGKIIATGSSSCSGIGGYGTTSKNRGSGTIIINGCDITATSTSSSGIGGGASASGGTIIINNGKINASCNSGTGIGSGSKNSTTGANITINGGIITAVGYNIDAGIGGGGVANTITINGGIINASVELSINKSYGAAIGGGGAS